MIKAVSSPRIDWLVSQVVGDKNIIDLKPIFAGGSMLSVYRAYRLYDTKDKWLQLKRVTEFGEQRFHSLYEKLDKFGDIDAWFPENHSVHNGGYGSMLISNEDEEDSLPLPLREGYREVKRSKWANSYRKRRDKLAAGGSDFIFQAIKNPISSVEDLFSDFDYVNCSVAYHDGMLYYDSNIDDAFNNFELRLNNDTNYKGPSMPKRVYSGLRAFKYSKRYSLDFSEVLSDLIYNIYVDLGAIDYSQYEDKVTLVNNVYGTTLMSQNDFRDMVMSFEQQFKYFTKMKTFKGHYAVYLIDRNLAGLRDYIDSCSGKGEGHFGHSPVVPF